MCKFVAEGKTCPHGGEHCNFGHNMEKYDANGKLKKPRISAYSYDQDEWTLGGDESAMYAAFANMVQSWSGDR